MSAGRRCCKFAARVGRGDPASSDATSPQDAIFGGFRDTAHMDSVTSDEAYQDQILPHVSRTFALTIPQLPSGLRQAVTSAYLLCRIADTIEDEPALSPSETLDFLQRFTAVVAGTAPPAPLAHDLDQRLTDRTLPTERDLVRNTERVINATARLG